LTPSAGRQVGIRIEPTLLLFYDLTTRELLRTRINPLTPEQIKKLRGLRPAGPPPRPATEPIRVQRRASATGVIMMLVLHAVCTRGCGFGARRTVGDWYPC
jgi:hypothetical protein